jgi:hypothetical protein
MTITDFSRRSFLSVIGAAACSPVFSSTAWGQAAAPALPLKNLGLEHLDILVPDTAASAKVYMRIFKTKLHQQPFQGSIRYFILLGDLPQNRQVGYIAIGAGGNRPTSIGHYCALAERYDRAGVAAALKAAGFSAGSGGGFGMLPDPDGLELQLFQPPAGLVTAAVPSPLEVETKDNAADQPGSPVASPRGGHPHRPAEGPGRREAAHRSLLHQGGCLRPQPRDRRPAADRLEDPDLRRRTRCLAVSGQLRHHGGTEVGVAGIP